MNTLINIGSIYNTKVLSISGLSTDIKPTDSIEGMKIINGSNYFELDTGKTYKFDESFKKWIVQNKVSTGGEFDSSILDDYAKKTEIPTKNSELENDSGYLMEHQSLTGYAKKTEVPIKVSELENDSGYLTEHQSLTEYAKKNTVENLNRILGVENSDESIISSGISTVSISNLCGTSATVQLKSDNLIELPYDNNFSNSNPNTDETVTSNGVTFKPNTDGSITIWGTATATTLYSLRNYYKSSNNTSRFHLSAGSYTVGIYSDSNFINSDSVRFVINKYSATPIYLDHPATFTITEEQASILTTAQIQVTTNFQNVEEGNPITIYPMLNSGNQLKSFNTPKKRLPSETSSYIPKTNCKISKDSSIEDLILSEVIQEINIQDIKTLSVMVPNKYIIEILTQSISSISDSSVLKIIKSALIGISPKCSRGNLNDGDEIILEESMAKKNKQLIFFGKINTMGTIKLYHGVNLYNSGYIEINATNLKVITYDTAEKVRKDVAHGLTLTDYIGVIAKTGNKNDLSVTLLTNGGSFTVENIWWGSSNGMIKVVSDGSVLENVSMTWNCSDFKKNIWIYGDSYFDFYNKARWTYHVVQWGFDNFASFGFPGAKSVDVYPEWIRTLEHGTPVYAVWCLGMNDIDTETGVNSEWKTYVDKFIQDCIDRKIIPVLATIPNTPNRRHTFKNEYVKNSGCRYVDFAKAVNAEGYPASWENSMLHTDNTHPTVEGATILAIEAVTDFSEFINGG